jgi:hypothetical protein
MKTHNKPQRLDLTEHAATALTWIADFSWLRSVELGRLMHPNDKHARKYAEAYMRKLTALRYVIPRKLPGKGAGNAFVLSAKGAEWLNTKNPDNHYKSGKNWGSIENGVWSPPRSWQHDLIAVGILALLSEKYGLIIYNEACLRRTVPDAQKHPDGLLTNEARKVSYWLEVENARKSGRNIDHLARALLNASRGTPVTYYDVVQHAPVIRGIVAINPDAKDERGYKLNHWYRIKNCLYRNRINEPVVLTICWFRMCGVGVRDIELQAITLSPK